MARITVSNLRKMKVENTKITMVTAYDWTMARLLELAKIEMVLVGDSLGMVVQGHEDTLPVTLDQMVYHTRCVSRALKQAHLVADMSFMSYQLGEVQALESAGRLVQEGRAQSVKLEGGARVAPAIRRIVEAGIPVVGHVGLTPQSVNTMSGFKVQGRSEEAAAQVLADALAVQEAGAFCVVVEGVPTELGKRITEALAIPTIGIGAGPHCDGQVLVCTDLLGMNQSFKPKFVKRYADFESEAVAAFQAYAAEVKAGSFPDAEHSFGVAAATLPKLY